MDEIEKILASGDQAAILALFKFTLDESDDEIIFKFNLWGRHLFPKYFTSDDAPEHEKIDKNNLATYRGTIKSFTDIGYRGLAKSTRTKLFAGFCIANDEKHFRKYLKVLTKELGNAKQYITDIYNMFMDTEMKILYPEVFAKTEFKREETMGGFMTATGIKTTADTVGTDQRGDLAEEARPDWIIFDDFETRKTLRSAVETKAIFDNMEEARNGLAKGGGMIYNCNYISERGNVHRLVMNEDSMNVVMNTPIKDKDGNPTWPARYSRADIEQLEKDVDDFEGEYMGQPSKSKDTLFDRDLLLNMEARQPVRTIGDFKIFYPYDPSHRYAIGADVAGGVGLDSSTSVVIDFSTIPARVAATYKSNMITPDQFGYELAGHGDRYGACLLAPEQNNHGNGTIAILKQKYDNLYSTQPKDSANADVPKPKEYGWHTNAGTKSKMVMEFKNAVNAGLLVLCDRDLINEAKSYSRDDLMDKEIDPRLSTRHFDLLTAAEIAWQMKDWAEVAPVEEVFHEDPPQFDEIGI